MSNALEGMTQARWAAMTKEARDRLRDMSGLSPQLSGLEGWRVEVCDGPDDKPRRFIVGRSTGWRPCHLEMKTRASISGEPARQRYSTVSAIERIRKSS